MPNAGGWSGAEFRPDTLARPEEEITHAQHYRILAHQGCDIFRTLGMKDVLTGKGLVMPEEAASRNLCFVSEQFAQKMFGTTQVIGQKIFDYENNPMEIGSNIPGNIIKILVKEGDKVEANQPIATIEAMKMETNILAAAGGIVEKIYVSEGQQVKAGEMVAKLKEK